MYAVRPKNMYNKEAYIYKGIVICIKIEVECSNHFAHAIASYGKIN